MGPLQAVSFRFELVWAHKAARKAGFVHSVDPGAGWVVAVLVRVVAALAQKVVALVRV